MTDTVAETVADGIKRGQLLVILIVATGLGVMSMNMVLPSLPSMAREFDTSYNAAQYVLTVFLFALSFAQLIYGVVSDRFGRRPVIIAGLVIFLVGSLMSALAWNLEMLLVGRFIQGAGGCAALVLGRAILRDLFTRDQAASLLGYVTMSMVLAPMLGPALGGLFEETLGWRAGILLLVVVGVGVTALVALRLPETHYNRGESSGFGSLIRSFWILAHNRLFLCFAAVMSFTSATFFGFIGGAPYIVIELMGRSPGEFGLWAMMLAAGYMLGNFVTGRYAQRVGTRRMISFGVILGVVGATALIVMAVAGPNIPIALFGPMMLVTFSNGLVMASAVSSSVSVRPDLAGAAAGLGGFLQMGAATVATIVVGATHNGTAIPLAIVIGACASAAFLAFLAAMRFPDPIEEPGH